MHANTREFGWKPWSAAFPRPRDEADAVGNAESCTQIS